MPGDKGPGTPPAPRAFPGAGPGNVPPNGGGETRPSHPLSRDDRETEVETESPPSPSYLHTLKMLNLERCCCQQKTQLNRTNANEWCVAAAEKLSPQTPALTPLTLASISLNHCFDNSRDQLVQLVGELVHTKPFGSFVQARGCFCDTLQYVKAKASET